MKTFKGAVYETGVYAAGIGLKEPCLGEVPDIKKKKENKRILNGFFFPTIL
jgi:hypothetical protein